ncbi:uncharacterized protein LOC111085290 isoform X2 [Limulus polyphemus]|uniref:Uncharacterized protein LOC111085290 isoform X2 n=1 Tax=Limulus polyphemus TaxID=6850 RepID=A0ABM1S5G2_LIMPO|nr:uncharacterized protein LOC111085290 isoform X2 [Limulus polyphemus]
MVELQNGNSKLVPCRECGHSDNDRSDEDKLIVRYNNCKLIQNYEVHSVASGNRLDGSSSNALFIQLLQDIKDGPKELARHIVPQYSTYGKWNVPCGLIHRPGHFMFRLITENKKKTLATTSLANVSWPKVSVQVPLLAETYSSDVTVRLTSSDIKCKPNNVGLYWSSIELVYLGPNFQVVYEGSSWFQSSTVFQTEVKSWPGSQPLEDVIVDCRVFDKPGIYQVQLVGSQRLLPPIAKSPHIQVIWSSRYDLSIPQSHIFPCDKGVLVIYEYPPCTLSGDRIRVYGRRSSPPITEYILETRIDNSKHSLTLPCDLFSSVYQTFCFTYVSVAANGAVFELKTLCRPRNIDPGGSRAWWSTWSSWSQCSSTCDSGIRSRYRLCSAPSDDTQCEGESTESEPCVFSECLEDTTTISDDLLLKINCNSSCKVNVTSNGTLTARISSGTLQPSFWTLEAWPEGKLSVQFVKVDIDSEFWLTVRDSTSPVGTLLTTVNNQMTYAPVESYSSTLRIDLHTSNGSVSTEGEFTLKFYIKGLKVSSLTAVWDGPSTGKVKFSAVHLTLVVLASVVGSAITILLVLQEVYNRCRQKRKSLCSESPCSSVHNIQEPCPKVKLLTGTTSVSDLSCSPASLRRQDKTATSQDKTVTSQDKVSPEELLHNTFLFRSTSSVCTLTPPQSPCPSLLQRRCLTPATRRKLPIAAVTPQPKPRSEGVRQNMSRHHVYKAVRNVCPTDMKSVDRLKDKSLKSESIVASTQSLSEFSIGESEDGLEYDYYDYSCHNDPGSFFCNDPALIGWPPFIPIYPGISEEDLPLQHFIMPQKEVSEEESIVS